MTQKMTLLLDDTTNDRLSYFVYKMKENRCELIRTLVKKGLTELEEEEKNSQKKSTWSYRGQS